ncbi:MAG: general secretion pathway protein GspK [Phycisphaeraceae bacterium]|nr:MAG: general secretion pathway protein GspK [Phycisphaeraceae bacterium]
MILTRRKPASRPPRRGASARRRASVVVIVLWAIAMGAIITASIQITGYRQAAMGTQAMERVRARWAARAGVERTISVLGYFTENPDATNAFRIYQEMAAIAYSDPGELEKAFYFIEHEVDGQRFAGPMDEHSRFNINLTPENRQPLLNLYIHESVVDAIVDWIDEDDVITGQGAEMTYYLSSSFGYVPRNAPMRSVAEVELVAGVTPEEVREEDWNYNNRLDPNEDDGNLLLPRDNANGVLEPGWARYLTAYSVAGGLSSSGQPRLYLPEAAIEDVQQRTRTSRDQAQALLNFGLNPNNKLSSLITVPINFIREDGSIADLNGQFANRALPLDYNQLVLVFSELTMDDPSFRLPGKININTASQDLLRDVLQFAPAAADEIVYRRTRNPSGFTSLMELIAVPDMNGATLQQIADVADVTSNVFTVTSVGRSETNGIEVQLIVVIDRSTLPVRILEIREQ